jgi:hypothetical protein
MPLYFFDVSEGGSPSVDVQGTELADIEAAEREAVAAAAAIGGELFQQRKIEKIAIAVREETSPLFTVTLAIRIDRVA